MKRVFSVVFVIVVMGLLSGCCVSHEWSEATCTEPKHCFKCGEVGGGARGHSWREATCTEPRTCSVCGATSGEAAGHKWVERTMEKPKTCSVCGLTEGEPIMFREFQFKKIVPADYIHVMFSADTIMGVKGEGEEGIVDFFDRDSEKKLATFNINQYLKEGSVWDYEMIPPLALSEIYFVYTIVDPDKKCTLLVIDPHGELVKKMQLMVDIPDGHRIRAQNVTEKKYVCFSDEDAGDRVILFYIDCLTWSVTKGDVEKSSDDLFYTNVYTSLATMYYCDKYLLARKKDGTVDIVNEYYQYAEGEYLDATQFNRLGLALACSEGKSYDIINTDLKVVAEGVFEGDRALWRGDTVFLINSDGVRHYYAIE